MTHGYRESARSRHCSEVEAAEVEPAATDVEAASVESPTTVEPAAVESTGSAHAGQRTTHHRAHHGAHEHGRQYTGVIPAGVVAIGLTGVPVRAPVTALVADQPHIRIAAFADPDGVGGARWNLPGHATGRCVGDVLGGGSVPGVEEARRATVGQRFALSPGTDPGGQPDRKSV